jgi:hypothetical protein
MKPTNALMLKLYFLHTICPNSDIFYLSWLLNINKAYIKLRIRRTSSLCLGSRYGTAVTPSSSTSGPTAYTPDALQPIGLWCDPESPPLPPVV